MSTITYTDGVTKTFGNAGKHFVDYVFQDDVLTVTVYHNQTDETGQGISQSIAIDATDPENRKFLLEELAGIGAAALLKDSLNAAKGFADKIEDEKVVEKGSFTIVKAKMDRIASRNLNFRETGVGARQPLSKLALAYAKANAIDSDSPEGYENIMKWYSAINKEARKDLAKEVASNKEHPLHAAYLAVDLEQFNERAEKARKLKEAAAQAATQKALEVLGLTE